MDVAITAPEAPQAAARWPLREDTPLRLPGVTRAYQAQLRTCPVLAVGIEQRCIT